MSTWPCYMCAGVGACWREVVARARTPRTAGDDSRASAASQVSWIQGNSFAQTMYAHAYVFPEALGALRAVLPGVAATVSLSEIEPGEGLPMLPDATQVPDYCRTIPAQVQQLPDYSSLGQVEPGSPQHTRGLAALACFTGMVKVADTARRFVESAEWAQPDGFSAHRLGMDAAVAVSYDEVLAMLLDAELAAKASVAGLHTHSGQTLGALLKELTAGPDDIATPAPAKRTRRRKKKAQGIEDLLPRGQAMQDARDRGFGLLADLAALGAANAPATSVHGHHTHLATFYAARSASVTPESVRDIRQSTETRLLAIREESPLAQKTGALALLASTYGVKRADATVDQVTAAMEAAAKPLIDFLELSDAEMLATEHALAPVPEPVSKDVRVLPLSADADAAVREAAELTLRLRVVRSLLLAYIHLFLAAMPDHNGMTPVLGCVAMVQSHLRGIAATLRADADASGEGVDADVPGFAPQYSTALLSMHPPATTPLPTYAETWKTLRQHADSLGLIACARVIVATASPDDLEGDVIRLNTVMQTLAAAPALLQDGFTTVSGPGLPSTSAKPEEAAWAQLREPDGRPAVSLRGVVKFLRCLDTADMVARSIGSSLVLSTPQDPNDPGMPMANGERFLNTHSVMELAVSWLRECGMLPQYEQLSNVQQFCQQYLSGLVATVASLLSMPIDRRARAVEQLDVVSIARAASLVDYELANYTLESIAGKPLPQVLEGADMNGFESAVQVPGSSSAAAAPAASSAAAGQRRALYALPVTEQLAKYVRPRLAKIAELAAKDRASEEPSAVGECRALLGSLVFHVYDHGPQFVTQPCHRLVHLLHQEHARACLACNLFAMDEQLEASLHSAGALRGTVSLSEAVQCASDQRAHWLRSCARAGLDPSSEAAAGKVLLSPRIVRPLARTMDTLEMHGQLALSNAIAGMSIASHRLGLLSPRAGPLAAARNGKAADDASDAAVASTLVSLSGRWAHRWQSLTAQLSGKVGTLHDWLRAVLPAGAVRGESKEDSALGMLQQAQDNASQAMSLLSESSTMLRDIIAGAKLPAAMPPLGRAELDTPAWACPRHALTTLLEISRAELRAASTSAIGVRQAASKLAEHDEIVGPDAEGAVQAAVRAAQPAITAEARKRFLLGKSHALDDVLLTACVDASVIAEEATQAAERMRREAAGEQVTPSTSGEPQGETRAQERIRIQQSVRAVTAVAVRELRAHASSLPRAQVSVAYPAPGVVKFDLQL